MPMRGAMPTWALIPFATTPAYVGYWYLFGAPLRFSSSSFGAAKEIGRLVWHDHPMAPWGLSLWVISAWLVAGIWLHRNAAHDARGGLPVWRSLVLAIALVFGGAFAVFWGAVGALQALRDPSAAPTGAGWMSLVAFVYALAAVRVAFGRIR